MVVSGSGEMGSGRVAGVREKKRERERRSEDNKVGSCFSALFLILPMDFPSVIIKWNYSFY